MNNEYVLIYDSGIGGLSVLNALDNKIHGAKFIYFGDNDNAPYGNLNEKRLFSMVQNNILSVPYDIGLIVLACNTLSVSVRKELQEATGVETVGVYPCVEREVVNANKTLLIGTPLTVSKVKEYDGLVKIGLGELAIDIERKIYNLDKLNLSNHFNATSNYSIEYIKSQKFDTVILGCTHYHFIENQIFNHFRPLKITSGNGYVVEQVVKKLRYQKTLEKIKQNHILFFGKNAEYNKMVYDFFYKKREKN